MTANEIINEIRELMRKLQALRGSEKKTKQSRHGKTHGRARIVLNSSQKVIYDQWVAGKITTKDCTQLLGVSKTTLYQIKKRGNK